MPTFRSIIFLEHPYKVNYNYLKKQGVSVAFSVGGTNTFSTSLLKSGASKTDFFSFPRNLLTESRGVLYYCWEILAKWGRHDIIPSKPLYYPVFPKNWSQVADVSILSQRRSAGFWAARTLNTDNFKIWKGQIFTTSSICVFVLWSLAQVDFKAVSCSLCQCLAITFDTAVWVSAAEHLSVIKIRYGACCARFLCQLMRLKFQYNALPGHTDTHTCGWCFMLPHPCISNLGDILVCW